MESKLTVKSNLQCILDGYYNRSYQGLGTLLIADQFLFFPELHPSLGHLAYVSVALRLVT